MLPVLRVLSLGLVGFCALERLMTPALRRREDAVGMAAALAPDAPWVHMRVLLLRLRPRGRAPVAAAAFAAAYVPRATALFVVRPQPVLLAMTCFFCLWEVVNGSWGAARAAAAFAGEGYIVRWPALIGALQLLLTAACHALPLRPARLHAAVMALRVLLLPMAAELFGARCWPALRAPVTWHGAHVALAAVLLLTQRARLRRAAAAARVAALTGSAASEKTRRRDGDAALDKKLR
jgi:hypothetical protein